MSDEMLRTLVDGMPQLAWAADAAGNIFWYNRRWHEYTGSSLPGMQAWHSAQHPDHVDAVSAGLRRAVAKAETWEDTFPLRSADGEYRWFLSRAIPTLDEAGRPVSWFGTHTDVTAQKMLEKRGQIDGERVRLALAAGAIIGTWFWDLRTGLLTIDEQFAKAFGVLNWQAGQDLPPEVVIASVHPDDKAGLELAIAQATARGGRYAHQYRVRRLDGNYYWIEANGRVDHAPDGTPTAFPGVLIDVEESRATSEALRDTSRRLDAILNNTQMAVFLMDDRQHCVYANPAAERLTGFDVSHMRGRALHDVVHHKKSDGSHYPIEECPIDRAFPERAHMQGEEWFVAPDGSFYPVAFTASPIVDDAGHPVGTVIEARNIAADKAREAALQESEAQQRSILNAIPQMVWTTRPDGHAEFFNDRWYEFTGAAHGSSEGAGWQDIVHPEDRELAGTLWRQSIATGQNYQIEYRLRHHSGEYRWVLGRGLPVPDSTGNIVRWLGTCTDIDELKRTGDELRRTSSLLQLIGQSTPDGIFAKDLHGRVIYANAAIERAVGRPLKEIIGFTDIDFAADENQARAVMANDQDVIESGETIDVDESYTSTDGETKHYRSVKAPLRNEHNEIVGIVGVTSDVTQRREAEERERLLAREVDHRAKNMLGVVQALVNLTRNQEPATFKRAVAGRIQSLARAHDLLVKSRWEGVSLKELVEQELAAFANNEGFARVLGQDLLLPPAFAQSLSLVLHELATNAAKYGALSAPGGQLELRWAIAPDDRASPLLHFTWKETGGPAVTQPGPAGFGSALIRSTVQRQLGGELTLEWCPEGLICNIRVPAGGIFHRKDASPDLAPSPHVSGPVNVEVLSGQRILVVEDEALIAIELEKMLVDAGCELMGPASSVEEAIRLLSASQPDAALLDVNLGGREFSYRLADALTERKVPFAFCTGYAGVSELPARFADALIIAKPVARSALISTVSQLLTTTQA